MTDAEIVALARKVLTARAQANAISNSRFDAVQKEYLKILAAAREANEHANLLACKFWDAVRETMPPTPPTDATTHRH